MISIKRLRPTQFAVGMYEVQKRIDKFRDMSKKEFIKYLKAKPIGVFYSMSRDAVPCPPCCFPKK